MAVTSAVANILICNDWDTFGCICATYRIGVKFQSTEPIPAFPLKHIPKDQFLLMSYFASISKIWLGGEKTFQPAFCRHKSSLFKSVICRIRVIEFCVTVVYCVVCTMNPNMYKSQSGHLKSFLLDFWNMKMTVGGCNFSQSVSALQSSIYLKCS